MLCILLQFYSMTNISHIFLVYFIPDGDSKIQNLWYNKNSHFLLKLLQQILYIVFWKERPISLGYKIPRKREIFNKFSVKFRQFKISDPGST